MKRKIEFRANDKASIQFRLRREPLLSSPIMFLLVASLLPWAVCIRVECQMGRGSATNAGQGQTQSGYGYGNSPVQSITQAQGPVISSGWVQSPTGITGSMSGRAKTLTRRLNNAPGVAGKADTSSLCFQPGIGWLQRPSNMDTANSAFHSVPISLHADAAKARRLPQAADSEDCTPSIAGANASLADLSVPGNARALLSAQSLGTASKTHSTAGPQSDSFTSSSGSANQGSQGPSAAFMVAPGGSGTSFSFSGGLTQGSMPITPSVSSVGDLYFSIPSPELATVKAADTTHGPLVGVITYSFSPGRDTGASRSVSGEKSTHVSSNTLEKERNRAIGHESEELRSQEKSASAETPVLAKDLHAYRQLKYFCLKIVAAQEAGGASDISAMELSGGHKATELLRLGQGCDTFLAMGRDAAIRKMQKHKGLK